MKTYLSVILVLGSLAGHAQNTDSLWQAYHAETVDTLSRIKTLHRIVRSQLYSDPDSALQLAYLEYELASTINDSNFMSHALNMQGSALTIKNEFAGALDKFYRFLDLREILADTIGIATAHNNIGNVFFHKGDYPRALSHYLRSLEMEKYSDSPNGMATSLINLGSVYGKQDAHEKAIQYFQNALRIYVQTGDLNGQAICYHNLGNAHKSLSHTHLAQTYYYQAMDLMQASGDDYNLAVVYSSLAEIYRQTDDYDQMRYYYAKSELLRIRLGDLFGLAHIWSARGTSYVLKGDYQQALAECQQAYVLADSLGAIDELYNACGCLYDAYKGLGKAEIALTYLEQYYDLEDSLAREETLMQLQLHEFQSQFARDSLQRAEEKRLAAGIHKQRDILFVAGAALLGALVLLFRLFRLTHLRKRKVEMEKNISDKMLLNLLPKEVAEELRKKGRVEAREFNQVSVLFTDFIGFTDASERMLPGEVVEELNLVYGRFDEIIKEFGLRKIKTIGDAYMAAGGLPVSSPFTISHMVKAAIAMQDFVEHHSREREKQGLHGFHMRAGIHSGPVVAGIIGFTNFQYDIWGDTVNLASRMEQAGAPGRINITRPVYEAIKNDPDLVFTYRGHVPVKGKGEVEMWFVGKQKPAQLDLSSMRIWQLEVGGVG